MILSPHLPLFLLFCPKRQVSEKEVSQLFKFTSSSQLRCRQQPRSLSCGPGLARCCGFHPTTSWILILISSLILWNERSDRPETTDPKPASSSIDRLRALGLAQDPIHTHQRFTTLIHNERPSQQQQQQ